MMETKALKQKNALMKVGFPAPNFDSSLGFVVSFDSSMKTQKKIIIKYLSF